MILKIEIGSNEAGQRLDKFLRKYLKDVPLSAIFKALRKGDIRINGAKQKEKYILNEGDLIEIKYLQSNIQKEKKKLNFQQVNANSLQIAYEDENILLVEKWPGVLVHSDRKNGQLTLNDYVLSFNVNTQRYEYKKVKRVLDNGEKELLLLVLENGQRLRCTPDHKLYTSEGYVEAQFAKDVLTKDGFSSVVFRNEDTIEEVYDIEVEDNHNFCVKDKNSDNFAVVHNCGA